MYLINSYNDILKITFESLTNLDSVDGFTDQTVGENSEIFFEKRFRYSLDNETFSAFEDLTDENLQALQVSKDNTYYFEFEYLKIGSGDLVVEDFRLLYTESQVQQVKQVNQYCCEIESVANVQTYITETCDLKAIFNPSDLSKTYEVTNQINQWLTNQYGHCIKYYRTDADQNTRDVILKEYTLYNISEVKDVNIVVPDNQFPDNAIEFSPIDMGFLDMPWEIHIGVREWCDKFGENTQPKRQDVLYIPLTNRIYQVESSYLYKDLIDKGTYWKLNLFKYQDQANRNFDTETVAQEEIDSFEGLTQSMDDAFGKEREQEIEKIVKEEQYEVIGTGGYDSTRLGLAKGLDIVTENLSNNYTIFSRYHYNLSSASAEYVSPYNAVAVEYREKPHLQINENLAYSAWFRIDDFKEQGTRAIDKVEPFSADASKLTFGAAHGYESGEIIEVNGINAINGVYEVSKISDTEITIQKPVSGSFLSLSGVTAQKQLVNNILRGYDTDTQKGIVIGVVNSGIIVKLNSMTYIFQNSFEKNKWYSTIINIGNVFDQISAYVYERKEAERTFKLNEVFKETKTLAKADFDLDMTYKVLGGNLSLTNIRLFAETIEPELHDNLLTQYIVKDNQLAYIIDNCIDPLQLSRIKNTQ